MPAAALSYAIQLLNTIIPLIPAASALFTSIQQQRSQLELMQAQGRDPTAEEWAALDALRDQLHKQVQA